jgi:UDP-N-acetylmuramyl tripeptide synthase
VVHASDPAVQPFADAAEAAGLQVARFDAYSDHEVLINGVKAELHLTMPGRINAANAAAALTLVAAWGLPLPAAIAAVEAEVGPPGRSQLIGGTQPFRVIVDFAHTGPSLTASVAVARELCSPEGRLLLVTGAAGERDPGRRTAVGQAATGADLVWIADEDPRGEDPNTIGEAIRVALPPLRPQVAALRSSMTVPPPFVRRSALPGRATSCFWQGRGMSERLSAAALTRPGMRRRRRVARSRRSAILQNYEH